MTVVPPAPAVADPMFTTVVDPDAPPVPRLTVLVVPLVVAPVSMPYVAVPVDVPVVAVAPDVVTVPEAVRVPEKVLLPVKVCVPARIASSDEVFGSVKLRVVPALIPASEKVAFFVGSASFTRLNTASETSRGSPTTAQALPVQTRKRPSAATHVSQPVRGTRRIHPPSTQKATFRSHPAQRPVAPEATRCRLPSAGLAGGVVRVRSRTESCTMASSRRKASLWVTCFCA